MSFIIKQIAPSLPSLNRSIYNRSAISEGWRKVHSVADSRVKEFKNEFIDIVDSTKKEIRVTRITEGFLSGDVNTINNEINWDRFNNRIGELRNLYGDIVIQSVEELRPLLPLSIRNTPFNIDNPNVQRLILSYFDEVQSVIVTESRSAVYNSILAINNSEFIGARMKAEQLRDLIGLTKRQAGANNKYFFNMIRNGVKKTTAQSRANTYALKQLDYRGVRFARQQSIHAANFGYHSLVDEAIRADGIDYSDVWKEWVVTPDDRLCPLCNQMDGQRVRLNERFTTPNGLLLHPPLHVNCRCSVTYSFN